MSDMMDARNRDLYMTAKQAAATLNISVKSLYAYVTRKNIRTRTEGSRQRYYWSEDIIRLARGEREIGPDSLLVPNSQITLLSDVGPIYRGRAAVDLARTATLEEAAAQLWGTDSESIFSHPPFRMSVAFSEARHAVSHLNIVGQAISLFPLIEEQSRRSFDLSPMGFAWNGADIIRWFAALMVGAAEPSERPVHEVVTRGSRATEKFGDLVRRVLVLAADHELSPATYAVRAAANTGVTAWQAVTVGLIASQGRRLTAGRSYSVRQLVAEIVTSNDAAGIILQRFRHDEPLPGFGDGVYPETDPRAAAVFAELSTTFGAMPAVQRMLAAVDAAREIYGRGPDFLVPVALVEYELGFDRFDGSLAMLGRIAGWVAHAAEQQSAGDIVRVRTAYSGL